MVIDFTHDKDFDSIPFDSMLRYHATEETLLFINFYASNYSTMNC